MNLNNLKPAWRQFQFVNSMQRMDQEEILLMLERAEGMGISKTSRFVILIVMFSVFTFCFQGG